MNIQQTNGRSVTEVLPALDALRRKHGPTSPIGHRCSNIAELLKMPELPTHLIRRQMDDLQQLLNDPQ